MANLRASAPAFVPRPPTLVGADSAQGAGPAQDVLAATVDSVAGQLSQLEVKKEFKVIPEARVEVLRANGQPAPAPIATFKELAEPHASRAHVPPGVLSAMQDDMHFVAPSIIQKAVLPLLLNNPPEHLLFQAPAGTGKTISFSLNMLSRCNPHEHFPQAIVTTTTDILVGQIHKELLKLTARYPEVSVDRIKSKEVLDGRNAHILCMTIGVMKNMLAQRKLNFAHVKVFVIDEADAMVADAVQTKDLADVMRNVKPGNTQLVMLSATFADKALKLAAKFFLTPTGVSFNQAKLLSEALDPRITHPQHAHVTQLYSNCYGDGDKVGFILFLLDNVSIAGQMLIFCEKKTDAAELNQVMQAAGHKTALLTGDVDKAFHDSILRDFESGKASALICTNMLARGIDIPKLSMVVQMDIPMTVEGSARLLDPESFYHRSGRVGRNKKHGTSIILLDTSSPRMEQENHKFLNLIQNEWGHTIVQLYRTVEDLQAKITSS